MTFQYPREFCDEVLAAIDGYGYEYDSLEREKDPTLMPTLLPLRQVPPTQSRIFGSGSGSGPASNIQGDRGLHSNYMPGQAIGNSQNLDRFRLAFAAQSIGAQESVLDINMRRMEAAGHLSSYDQNILDMMTSDEEDNVPKGKKVSMQVSTPLWMDLPVELKVQLHDVVRIKFPEHDFVELLHLTESDFDEVCELVRKRNEYEDRMEEARNDLGDKLHHLLLRGAPTDKEEIDRLTEENLWQLIDQDMPDYHLSTFARDKQATAYLRYCNLDPHLWDERAVDAEERLAKRAQDSHGPKEDANSLFNPLYPPPRHFHVPAFVQADYFEQEGIKASFLQQNEIQDEDNHPQLHESAIETSDHAGTSPHTLPNLLTPRRQPRSRPSALNLNTNNNRVQVNPTESGSNTPKTTSSGSEKTPTKQFMFLGAERRPGARQPKLTKKVIEPQAAAPIKATATRQKKGGKPGMKKKNLASPSFKRGNAGRTNTAAGTANKGKPRPSNSNAAYSTANPTTLPKVTETDKQGKTTSQGASSAAQ